MPASIFSFTWRSPYQRLPASLLKSFPEGALKKRAAAAIEVCPKKAHRQIAFLHVLLGDYASAAKLLTSVPGLVWSDSEHAGHLLFPIFCRLLHNDPPGYPDRKALHPDTFDNPVRDIDELKSLNMDPNEPCLSNPSVGEILDLAGLDAVKSEGERSSLIRAMQKAARKRIEGVAQHKRRRH